MEIHRNHLPIFRPCVGAVLALLLGNCGDPITPKPPVLGPEWITYTHANSPLVHDGVNSIEIHREEIWIGTDAGVSKLTGTRWETLPDSFLFVIGPIESRKVTAIHVDPRGTVWFGLAGGGIRSFNTHSNLEPWRRFTTPALTSDYVYDIVSDIQGDVWFATGFGVSRFHYGQSSEVSDGSTSQYTQRNSLIPDEAIRSVGYSFYDNTIWFGTTSIGMVSYDGDLDWNLSLPVDQPLPFVSMDFGSDRTIWFGSFGDWAYHYSIESSEWQWFGGPDSGNGLPGNLVSAIVVDGSTIWFGTNGGLAGLRDHEWIIYDVDNSPLPTNAITCLARDIKGNLWIGTSRGILKFREGGTVL